MQIQFDFRFKDDAKVVICFKFSNFAYANTVDEGQITRAGSCYLL